jgi:hypothetical protein
MDTTEIKEEIHQFIDHANERVLNLIYRLIKTEQQEDINEKAVHDKLLDHRLKEQKENKDKGSIWSQSKTEI